MVFVFMVFSLLENKPNIMKKTIVLFELAKIFLSLDQ